MRRIFGFLALFISMLIWVMAFAVPFLAHYIVAWDGVGAHFGVFGLLYILAEVFWYGGALLLGKELISLTRRAWRCITSLFRQAR
ncbi:hypothetical protein [Pseudovibrio sp. Tun.PSC04-5.I4]|uniref:hypothetical protein n=1 Tax=Pseudovibrio sp. Tun.PSC04-5.I4 TaxID=1798213 RepID=UPI001179A867|nr:hypothetical protein [Pseudovibrio sp. Tun.PSC04-5.I4]